MEPAGELSLAGVHIELLCEFLRQVSHLQAVRERSVLPVMQQEQPQVSRLLPGQSQSACERCQVRLQQL
jgi:hypothetical protein